MTRRVVITGMGVIAAGAPDKTAFWDMLTSGESAIRRISSFDPAPFRSQIAGECDFDPVAYGFSAREIRRTDRATQFAMACARAACEEANLHGDAVDPARVGVVVGTAIGGATALEREYVVLSDAGAEWTVDPAYRSPHLFGHFVPSSIAAEVARDVGAGGPVTVLSTGCTSGIDAIGYACEVIEDDAADIVVAGGTEAPITPMTVACFDAIKATTPDNSDPPTACRPFDVRRNGFVLAEGAAMFVLEEYETARRRGHPILAEVGGYAARCNAFHMTGLKADGLEMSAAIDAALRQAGLAPTAVDYVNAHGSGTRQNDLHETAALKRSLGENAYRVPVSSIKSMIGHSLGAVGAIEIAACTLAMLTDTVPPTANLTEPDPTCDLDYVPLRSRSHRVDTALTVGSGFGGFQSALVLNDPAVTR